MISLVTLLALGACTPVLVSPHADDTAAPWMAPKNSWPTATPPQDLVGEGFSEGLVPFDFLFMDQFGDDVALWQFYGLVMVMDISTIWCGPCQNLARGVNDTWLDYKDQGFIYLTLLPENMDGDVPGLKDLQSWANGFGITAPVLADDAGYCYDVVPDTIYPQVLVIDRDMRVFDGDVVPTDDATIRSVIESLL